MVADEKIRRHHRTMDFVVENAEIMKNASAVDWRILHALEQHAGYNTWKTFPLSLAHIAKDAFCSRRAAIRSTRWWRQMGIIGIRRDKRFNIYEILRILQPSPEKGASPRHLTPRSLKRDHQGRIVPSVGTPKVPAHGTLGVPAHGTHSEKFLSEVFSENPPSPPTGGSGRASGTSARPSLTLTISDSTIRKLMEIKTREEVIEILKKGGYPVPPFLLGVDNERPDGRAQDPGPNPGCKSAASPVMNPDTGPDHQGKSTDSPSVAGDK